MSIEELRSSVASLDEATVQRLLVGAARSNPSVAGSIMQEVSVKQLWESQEKSYFGISTKRTENSVDRGMRLRPSQQFEIAYSIVSDLKDAIQSIEQPINVHRSLRPSSGR